MRLCLNRKVRLEFAMFLFTCFWAVLYFLYVQVEAEEYTSENPVGAVQINEVCTVNPGTPVGDSVIYEDYIELYNPTKERISLDKFYLSDKEGKLDLGVLPDDSIEPGGYYVIYASGLSGAVPFGCPELPFCLSENETIYLSFCSEGWGGKKKFTVIDSVLLPSLSRGAVYGRIQEGEEFAKLRPSPGASNTNVLILEKPVLSERSGFYEGEITLEMYGPNEIPVYYTLDGSRPTRNSSVYTEPLILRDPSDSDNIYSARTDIAAKSSGYTAPKNLVDKAVVVCAAAIDEYGNYSNTVTATYFIDFQNKEGYEGAPVVSIITDPENFFGSEAGIYIRGDLYEGGLEAGVINEALSWIELMDYMNYYLEGRESERETHIDVFDENHLFSLGQECGIRIRGNESRSFPQKSFTLFARKCYGSNSFAPIFFDSGIAYPDLILNQGAKLTKVFFYPLVEDRSALVQQYTPCQVFLNGEYWGMYYLMEKYSSEFLEGYYQVNAEDTLLIKATMEVQDGDQEDISLFRELCGYLEQDMSDPLLYNELLEQMDMQSFIDWMCTNIYIGNTDSKPLGGNVFTWKTTISSDIEYGDGKWRWMLYDLDDSLSVGIDTSDTPSYAVDSFTEHPGYSSCGFLKDAPMPSLMENEDFRRQFVITFMDMANENFKASHVLSLLDKIEEEYTPWADKNYERWGTNTTDASFGEQIDELRIFFEKRYDYIVPCLAEHFSLKGELVTFKLSAENSQGGTVTLNTFTPDLAGDGWEGKYYTDYTMSLTAEVAEGYTFEGWKIDGGKIADGSASSETICVQLMPEGTSVQAVFKEEDR